MKELEKTLKALANGRRLAIIKFLQNTKEATVGEIADNINLSFKATSRHLNVLANADILEKEQRSLQMFYRLPRKLSSIIKSVISFL